MIPTYLDTNLTALITCLSVCHTRPGACCGYAAAQAESTRQARSPSPLRLYVTLSSLVEVFRTFFAFRLRFLAVSVFLHCYRVEDYRKNKGLNKEKEEYSAQSKTEGCIYGSILFVGL